MPLYEYRCPRCGRQFEELVAVAAESPACPDCGSEGAVRLMSAAAAVGSGPATPDARGHGCCGTRPSDKGCVPGTCCGRTR